MRVRASLSTALLLLTGCAGLWVRIRPEVRTSLRSRNPDTAPARRPSLPLGKKQAEVGTPGCACHSHRS
jgi:hypothetical protein